MKNVHLYLLMDIVDRFCRTLGISHQTSRITGRRMFGLRLGPIENKPPNKVERGDGIFERGMADTGITCLNQNSEIFTNP